MKSVCLLSRRPGTTREMFRDYYETRHCLLGMRYFPFAKYLRNHVIDASTAIDFDCVSEFYFDEGPGGADPMAGPAGEILRADERKFMDQGLIRPALAQESLLAGPARDIARPGSRRQMLMLGAPADSADASWVAAVRDWGIALAHAHAGVMRVTLDLTAAFAPGANGFPFRAILSLWLAEQAGALALTAPPAPITAGVCLLVDVCESPPEQIRALYNPG